MSMLKRPLIPLVMAALVGAVGLTASPANAAGSNGDGQVTTQTATMYRSGVNHEIAAAHGYEVRVDAEGVEYAVKRGAITPMTTVAGNCGTSTITFTAVDTRKHYSSVYTGFHLAPGYSGAVYVDWDIDIIDHWGVSTPSWHDPAASVHDWYKVKGFTSSGAGPAQADILLGSIATLWDGTICFAYPVHTSANL